MRKLNKSEIDALTNKIYKELDLPSPEDYEKELKDEYRKKYLKLIKDFDNSKDGKVLRKYNCKIDPLGYLKSLPGSVIGSYGGGCNSIRIETTNDSAYIGLNIVISSIKENEYPTRRNIREAIILAQIETKDLSEIIAKVKSNFNLK